MFKVNNFVQNEEENVGLGYQGPERRPMKY